MPGVVVVAGGVVLELPPPQPTKVIVIIRTSIPRTTAIWRLRFLLVPARIKPKSPNPPRLAHSVGFIGSEFGWNGVTKDVVAAAVLMVRVVGTAVVPANVTDPGLKLQVALDGHPVALKEIVPV